MHRWLGLQRGAGHVQGGWCLCVDHHGALPNCLVFYERKRIRRSRGRHLRWKWQLSGDGWFGQLWQLHLRRNSVLQYVYAYQRDYKLRKRQEVQPGGDLHRPSSGRVVQRRWRLREYELRRWGVLFVCLVSRRILFERIVDTRQSVHDRNLFFSCARFMRWGTVVCQRHQLQHDLHRSRNGLSGASANGLRFRDDVHLTVSGIFLL